MTQKQLARFLRYLRRKKEISRKELLAYFSKCDSPEDCIWLLEKDNYIKMISEPIMVRGHQNLCDSDMFSMGIAGYDLLDKRSDAFFLNRLPVIISILALMKSYRIGPDDIIFWCMQQLGLLPK